MEPPRGTALDTWRQTSMPGHVAVRGHVAVEGHVVVGDTWPWVDTWLWTECVPRLPVITLRALSVPFPYAYNPVPLCQVMRTVPYDWY
eukprot:486172-Rhodomonas_salina.1